MQQLKLQQQWRPGLVSSVNWCSGIGLNASVLICTSRASCSLPLVPNSLFVGSLAWGELHTPVSVRPSLSYSSACHSVLLYGSLSQHAPLYSFLSVPVTPWLPFCRLMGSLWALVCFHWPGKTSSGFNRTKSVVSSTELHSWRKNTNRWSKTLLSYKGWSPSLVKKQTI